MTKILRRILTTAGLAGAAVVVAAGPASANLIGDDLGVIGLASQNSANNNGNSAGSAGHSSGTQNVAQHNVADQQSIDVPKNVNVAEDPLVLV